VFARTWETSCPFVTVCVRKAQRLAETVFGLADLTDYHQRRLR
jgi:hypothetical protein